MMTATLMLFAILGPKPVCGPHPSAKGETWCTLKLKSPASAEQNFEVTTDKGKKIPVSIHSGQTSVGWPMSAGDRIKSFGRKKGM